MALAAVREAITVFCSTQWAKHWLDQTFFKFLGPTSGSAKLITSAFPCSRLSLVSREVTAFAKCTSASVPAVRLLTRFYRARSIGSQDLPVHQQSLTTRHPELFFL